MTPAGLGALGIPLTQEQSCSHSYSPASAEMCAGEHCTQGCSSGCELEPEVETLPGATRSNSLFECNTNSYPEKPFPLQIAGFWRLQLGKEVPVLQARAGCCWVLWALRQERAAAVLTCFRKIWATKKVNYIFKFLSVVKSCNYGLKLTVLYPAIKRQRGFAGSGGGWPCLPSLHTTGSQNIPLMELNRAGKYFPWKSRICRCVAPTNAKSIRAPITKAPR